MRWKKERIKIKVKKNRYKLTNEEIDFTIIEIIKEDKITDFIQIDENVKNDNFKIKNCFCFQYPGGKSLHKFTWKNFW
jgi:hypothetical protein